MKQLEQVVILSLALARNEELDNLTHNTRHDGRISGDGAHLGYEYDGDENGNEDDGDGDDDDHDTSSLAEDGSQEEDYTTDDEPMYEEKDDLNDLDSFQSQHNEENDTEGDGSSDNEEAYSTHSPKKGRSWNRSRSLSL